MAPDSGWWGILGLIGWAYLTAALLTLALGRRREWLMGAMGLLMALHLAMNHGGLFSRVDKKPWLGPARPAVEALKGGIDGVNRYVGLGDATGSLAAIAMAGCLLGTSSGATPTSRPTALGSPGRRRSPSACSPPGSSPTPSRGSTRSPATPTWCFYSAALACLTWMVLYLLMDVAGYSGFSILIRPAGANPLVAYFLHPITVGTVALSGLGGTLLGYRSSPNPMVVVAGSLAMACFVCAVTGLLGKAGLRVKL